MCEKHTELFKEMLETTTSDVLKTIANRAVGSKKKIEIDEKIALELLLGIVDLSQQGYNNFRLFFPNVGLPPYKKVMK